MKKKNKHTGSDFARWLTEKADGYDDAGEQIKKLEAMVRTALGKQDKARKITHLQGAKWAKCIKDLEGATAHIIHLREVLQAVLETEYIPVSKFKKAISDAEHALSVTSGYAIPDKDKRSKK